MMADSPLFFYNMVAIVQSQLFNSLKLPLKPSPNQGHNKIDLHLIRRPTLLDSVPFLNAFPTTGGSSVLCGENRMPAVISIYGP
jgi:hypothetical protein